MRVTALGHAGLGVDVGDASILLDPWLSPDGAFQASWFQFPDNTALLKDPTLFAPTAVAVSHEHYDHLDPWFLQQLAPDVPVVVPRYPSRTLRNKLRAGGDRPIVELDPWEPWELVPGTRVFFVSEESPMNHDSAIVVTSGAHTLVDLNDARLFPMQFRRIRDAIGGTVDVLTLQGAGASWFPMCYRYPEEKKRRLSRQKRLAKLAYVERAIEIVEPVVAVPFAGPPCFLDEELFHHNAEMSGEGIFPDQHQVVDWLADRGVSSAAALLPGDAWETEDRSMVSEGKWDGFSEQDRDEYLEQYAARRRSLILAVKARYQEPDGSLGPAFGEYFERLVALNPSFNARIDMRVGFEVTGPGGGEWSVDFRPGKEGVVDSIDDCGYVYTLESRWLAPILAGDVLWEDFLLSLRFEARRDPDVYNDHLLGLMKFADPDALAAVERYEQTIGVEERIVVESEGRAYSIGRYCPHAGNDLKETGAVRDGGVIQCLAHHYEFSLETGECLNGSCPALPVEALDATEAAG